MEQITNTNSGDFKTTQQMLDTMHTTRRWVRFLSIFGFVIAGILFVFFLFQFIFIRSGVGGINNLLMMIVFPVVLFFVYFFPSFLLSKYASSIGRFIKDASTITIENVLKCQKNFWKYVGILLLVTIGVYIIIMVVVLPGLLGTFLSGKQP